MKSRSEKLPKSRSHPIRASVLSAAVEASGIALPVELTNWDRFDYAFQADASWEKKLPGATATDELRAREAVTRPVAEYLAALDAALPPNPDEPEPAEPVHVSPTDPQAAFTRKGGFAHYAYAINPLLDLDTDCILDVEATPARFSVEVAATRTLVSRIKDKLGITPASLAADKAYGSGPLLGWLIDQGITPHVPVIDRTRQRDGFFTRDAFRAG